MKNPHLLVVYKQFRELKTVQEKLVFLNELMKNNELAKYNIKLPNIIAGWASK